MDEELFTTLDAFDGPLYRNIYGVRPSISVYDDLADDEATRRFAAAAEAATRPDSPSPLITRPFDYALPFEEGRELRATRYSDGSFGVWYASLDGPTTVHETVYHWLLGIVGKPEAMAAEDGRSFVTDRRVFTARCAALLVDLRGKERHHPGLVDAHSYQFTQPVGRYLHDQGMNGLLARSARCAGDNAAILRPDILSGPRDRYYLRYRWRPGAPDVRVERASGRRWMSVPVAGLGLPPGSI